MKAIKKISFRFLVILLSLSIASGVNVPRGSISVYAVESAMVNFLPSAESQEVMALVWEILSGSFSLDMEFGINYFREYRSDGTPTANQDEDNRIMQMFTLYNTTRRNIEQEALSSSFAVAMSDDPIFNLDLHLDRDITAFQIPQAYDGFVYGNTNRLRTDWHFSIFNSGFGRLPSDEENEELYQFLVNNILNFDPTAFNAADLDIDFNQLLVELMSVMEIDGNTIIIPGEALPGLVKSVVAQIIHSPIYSMLPWNLRSELLWYYEWMLVMDSYEEHTSIPDIKITIYTEGFIPTAIYIYVEDYLEGSIRFADGNTIGFNFYVVDGNSNRNLNGEFIFDTQDRLFYQFDVNITDYRDGELNSSYTMQATLDWDFNQTTGDNFSLNMESNTWYYWRDRGDRTAITVDGNVIASPATSRIVANFPNIRVEGYSWGWTTIFSYSHSYVLQADNTPINFNRSDATALSDFTEEMYTAAEDKFEEWLNDMEARFDELTLDE